MCACVPHAHEVVGRRAHRAEAVEEEVKTLCEFEEVEGKEVGGVLRVLQLCVVSGDCRPPSMDAAMWERLPHVRETAQHVTSTTYDFSRCSNPRHTRDPISS